MNIGILGAGAMGLLYGGYLSQENQLFMICRRAEQIEKINNEGVTIEESDGTKKNYHPKAVLTGSENIPSLDILILFVKSGASRVALEENEHLLGKNTILLTLQNGSGHEDILKEFADAEKIAIGVSQDGSLLISDNQVRHTGSAMTYFGLASGAEHETLDLFEKTCINCGFNAEQSNRIKWFIWEKLMINASSSVLSGVLAMPQGYCFTDKSAWLTIQALVEEMVEVAVADGIELDYPTQIDRLEKHLTTNPQGVPSIQVDLKEGRITEVDSISGSVVKAGKRLGVQTPTHTTIVNLVHAMERRSIH